MATDIPLDTWPEIFVRLPAKSLLRCRAVSKAWRAFIDDRCFVRAYTKRQLTCKTSTNIIIYTSAGPPFPPLFSLNLDSLNFDGSSQQTVAVTPLDFTPPGDRFAFPVAACDGLMLIAPQKRKQKWQIWNPSTQESLDLPRPGFDSLKPQATGQRYDKLTDDYKAVVIDFHSLHSRTHVYSLKSDSWRTITNVPGQRRRGPLGTGVFMCGSLNWIHNLSRTRDYVTIIALDLGTETYCELKVQVPGLPFRNFKMIQKRSLNVLDSGRLIMSDCVVTNDNKLRNFDVWVMRDYEADDSWSRCLSVDSCNVLYDLRYLAFLEERLQFFLQTHQGFYLHDVRTSSAKRLDIKGHSGFLSAQVVPESIFRLHDNCGVRGRKRIVMDRVQMSEYEKE
ncbi:hypothetical protein CASFOL_034044 [Castilleja foliolosa]|uniref:F-box domain-containing protein n=1 Tax=Castilleja foliolosa TaxID=1961234 RepID=A0ABD3BYN8_9LAMI